MIQEHSPEIQTSSNGHPKSEPAPPEQEKNLYLTGWPTLKQFLSFVRDRAIDERPEGDLVDEWHTASVEVRRIEADEAGAADNPPIAKLGPEYEPLLIELLADPILKNSFNTVPTQIALVELDRLVVYQKHIDITHAGRLAEKLGPAPDRDAVFRACLPATHPQPPVTWAQTGSNTFTFLSPSRDLRFLEAMHLGAAHVTGYPPPGDLVGVVGIGVGFGSNFLNAVYAENRLILNNGSHRAYALRKMGLTHVPCIVQHVSTRESLNVVATRDIRQNADYFLKHPRPSMLRDYLNPAVHKVLPVCRRLRQVTIKYDITETYIPAL